MKYQNPPKLIPDPNPKTNGINVLVTTALIGVTSIVAYSLACSKLGFHMSRPIRMEHNPEGGIRLVSRTITSAKWYADLIQK